MGIFLIWAILSFVIGGWSKNKGRGFAFGFWLSLLLSPLVGGFIVAVAKPNVKEIENREVDSGDMKKCPYCAELVW